MDLLHAYSKHVHGRIDASGLIAVAAKGARPDAAITRPKRAAQLRPEEIDRLVETYHRSGSVAATAREFGIARQTVGRHLSERSVETVRHLTAEQIAHAVESYRRGESAAIVGARLGFTAAAILKALREKGVSIRPGRGGRGSTN